jgi:hypothetical protein
MNILEHHYNSAELKFMNWKKNTWVSATEYDSVLLLSVFVC